MSHTGILTLRLDPLCYRRCLVVSRFELLTTNVVRGMTWLCLTRHIYSPVRQTHSKSSVVTIMLLDFEIHSHLGCTLPTHPPSQTLVWRLTWAPQGLLLAPTTKLTPDKGIQYCIGMPTPWIQYPFNEILVWPSTIEGHNSRVTDKSGTQYL